MAIGGGSGEGMGGSLATGGLRGEAAGDREFEGFLFFFVFSWFEALAVAWGR